MLKLWIRVLLFYILSRDLLWKRMIYFIYHANFIYSNVLLLISHIDLYGKYDRHRILNINCCKFNEFTFESELNVRVQTEQKNYQLFVIKY